MDFGLGCLELCYRLVQGFRPALGLTHCIVELLYHFELLGPCAFVHTLLVYMCTIYALAELGCLYRLFTGATQQF